MGPEVADQLSVLSELFRVVDTRTRSSTAALLLEHGSPQSIFSRIAQALRRGGLLSVVLQMHSAAPGVTPTPYLSLHQLEKIMRTVPQEELLQTATAVGLKLRVPRAPARHRQALLGQAARAMLSPVSGHRPGGRGSRLLSSHPDEAQQLKMRSQDHGL